MRRRHTIVRSARLVLLLGFVTQAALAESSFSVSGRYTAQRKPRITVLEFQNTNAMAQSERYGSSVEAMLVTFFKRKSQFVVVERQKLGTVLEEWQRNQSGMTNLKQGEPGARELLEKIDGIVLGNVTLLNAMAQATTAAKQGAEQRPAEVIRGQRIEIDAKLLSRTDGRIIAAAQRSGPVSCLRAIVERLGVALESEFLRPYYGKLTFKFSEPENVRMFLTPILLDTALDEEKPPVERSSTVLIQADQDKVEPWATNPTTYTIGDVLSGFYSLRLERPGYESIGTESSRWEARDDFGRVVVRDRTTGQPLDLSDRTQARFIVRVDPLATETIDGDALAFSFRKLGGSIEVRAKREYLDADFASSPEMRVMLVGNDGMEINRAGSLSEYADDKICDFFEEVTPPLANVGVTRIAAGRTFDFQGFKGGGLIFDDYRGETLPVGTYKMLVRARHYESDESDVTVRDQDRNKPVRISLLRQSAPLTVTVTGDRAGAALRLEGRVTRKHPDVPLDSVGRALPLRLPVDEYTAQTDVPGLGKWQRSIDLLSQPAVAAAVDSEPKGQPGVAGDPKGERASATENAAARLATAAPSKDGARAPSLHVKTRLSVGGRTTLLDAALDSKKGDLYVDREVARMLDALIGPPWTPAIDPKQPSLLSQIARTLVPGFAPQPAPTPSAVSPGEAGPRTGDSAPSRPPTSGPGAVPATGRAAPAMHGGEAHATLLDEPAAGGLTEALPADPEELAKALAERLREIDLLVLNDQDLVRLLARAEMADARTAATEVVRDFIEQGGALLTFASAGGDYQRVLGAPFALDDKPKRSTRFELSGGDVANVRLGTVAKVEVASKRLLPQVKKDRLEGEWRVLAYTRGRKDPRILERGARDHGGYVLVWCDEPLALQGRKGADAPALRAARTEVARRALAWARYIMYRRYDATGEELRRAAQALDAPRAAR